MEELLFEDLRIDEDAFNELNKDDIRFFAERYSCKNVKLLSEYMGC